MAEDFYCTEVLSGHTPVECVAETDGVLAFYHTRPYWPVHIVVIPKRHVESLLAVSVDDIDLLRDMLAVIQQVAAQVIQEHGACRVVTHLGAYQDSKHLHWHIGAGAPLR